MTDVELLNQHRTGSESAFADLVRRHLGWVYGVAQRRLRDAHLAEDAAQAVFVLLHRKSPRFAADRALVTWLHKTAWYVAESASRSERRRIDREMEAAKMRPTTDSAQPAEWQELAPLLDELIERLPKADREAILLRYYRDLSMAELAGQIGTTSDTARKRVERAVEKLRRLATEKGAPASMTSLAAGLTSLVRITPPPGLIATATVTATAPAGSAMAASTVNIVKGAITMMKTAKLTIVAFTAAAVLLTGGLITGTAWMLARAQTDAPNTQSSTTLPDLSPTTVPSPVPTPDQAPAAPPVPFDANGPIPKVAPFSAIRWHANVPQVQVNGTWYELVAIDDLPIKQIFNFQKSSGDSSWQKHFGEDLPEVLTNMHRSVNTTVNLQVHTLDDKKTLSTLPNIPMTAENRTALMNWSDPDQTVLFSNIRWQDNVPQVDINGTWYELISVQHESARNLIDSAKNAHSGDQWKDQFQNNLMDILKRRSDWPLYTVDLQLRTLDSKEQIAMTIRVPQQN